MEVIMKNSRKQFLVASILIATAVLNGCVSMTILPKPFGNLQKNEIIDKYLTDRDLEPIEGTWIWEGNEYEVAIIKNKSAIVSPEYDYVGVITDTTRSGWNRGETKLLIKKTASENVYSAIYYMGNKHQTGTVIIMPNNNMLEMSIPSGPYGLKQKILLIRTLPQDKDNKFLKGGEQIRSATGFFIAKEILATNYHVVADRKDINVL